MGVFFLIACAILAGVLTPSLAGGAKRAKSPKLLKAPRLRGDELTPAIPGAGPMAGVDEIIFACRQLNYDPHWYANFGYYAENADRKAYRAMGRLCKLNLITTQVTVLLDDPQGTVRDPQVHYDGGKIFKKAGCARCHPSPLYTDMNKYNVETGKGMEKNLAFDTPTLVEVWRTAPYLHDGRAATMKEVLTKHNYGDKHGVTSNLTENEIDDLAEFVLSQ